MKNQELFEIYQAAKTNFNKILSTVNKICLDRGVILSDEPTEEEADLFIEKESAIMREFGYYAAFKARQDAAENLLSYADSHFKIAFPVQYEMIKPLFEGLNRIVYREKLIALLGKTDF